MRNRATMIAALAVSVAACGSGDAGGIDIEAAWARTSPAMANTGAAYMQITTAEDDSLVSASVDPEVAGTVEIHEVVMVEDAMTGDTMAEGAMTMQQIESLPLPAGETVALEPGGYHIMLLDLPDALETGETFDLTLTFANAGEQVVSVEVREDAP